MLNKLREPLKGTINFIALPFMAVPPNILSFFTIILGIPGFYFYTQGNTLLGSLFVIGAGFDVIDGAVARKTGKKSAFGGVLDATLDRIFETILLLSIGIGGIIEWEILFVFLGISLAVSYIKAKAEAVVSSDNVGYNKFSVGIGERGDRMLILFLSSILNYFVTKETNNLFVAAVILLIILSSITFVWRFLVIKSELSK